MCAKHTVIGKAADTLFPYATGAGQERDAANAAGGATTMDQVTAAANRTLLPAPDGSGGGDYALANSPGNAADPLAAPDLTDEALKKARRAQALSLLTKRGRASTFLTGGGGGYATGAPPGQLTGLGMRGVPPVSGFTAARNTFLGGR